MNMRPLVGEQNGKYGQGCACHAEALVGRVTPCAPLPNPEGGVQRTARPTNLPRDLRVSPCALLPTDNECCAFGAKQSPAGMAVLTSRAARAEPLQSEARDFPRIF